MTVANACVYLNNAVDVLASVAARPREWPVDLDESAPHWADLMEQLGEIAHWVTQGAVVVRDEADTLPPNQARPLAATATELMKTLAAVTAHRPELDHAWRAVAATFAQERDAIPRDQHPTTRETRVAGAVHDAAQAVRNAATQRLTAEDVVPVLTAAGEVCEAMCGLVTRLSAAVDHRDHGSQALAAVSRSLRRGLRDRYRVAGEYLASAVWTCDQITTRWPGRWPTSV